MNLSEEKNYQKRMSILDLMKLTPKNRVLAEQYLDMNSEENAALLAQAQLQDLSAISQEDRRRCTEYTEHLKKRGRTEELKRYVKFAAAAGGSTAVYVLVSYGWNLNTILEYLTREQAAAIRAEGMVWNIYSLRNAVERISQKDPVVLKDAMKLCAHKSDNAKVLLAGICLYHTEPENNTGILKKLFSSKEQGKEWIPQTVRFLEDNLIGSTPNMFLSGGLTEAEQRELSDFVKNTAPDAPFPVSIRTILNNKQTSEYLVSLLAGAAFLAYRHSDRLAAFLRLCAAMRPLTVLDICRDIAGKPNLNKRLEELEKFLPIPKDIYTKWCVTNSVNTALKRMAVKYPDIIRLVITEASADEYQYLMNQVKESNRSLYQELNKSMAGEVQVKIAQELTARYTTGQAEARQYLLGDTELDALYPFVKDWRGMWIYGANQYTKIENLYKSGGEEMYRRAVVLAALRMNGDFFNRSRIMGESGSAVKSGNYNNGLNRQQIKNILWVFDREKLPVSYQLDALAGIHDSFYTEQNKTAFLNECVMVIAGKRQEWSEELVRSAREGIAMSRFLCIRVMDTFWDTYKETLLACASDSSKQVRELLVAVYASHREWEADIRSMLGSKKSQEREMAVLVLKKWGAENYREELEEALKTEKSKKIKELLQSCLGTEKDTGTSAQEQTAEDLVKELLKGGKKRKLSWIYENETVFPVVHRTDGTAADEDYLQALLISYADMNVPGVSKDAGKLAGVLDEKELASYVRLVFDRWLQSGAEAKKKWVLYAASIHGGEEIVPVLNHQIQEWPKNARGAMAAEAVKALALNGSATALLIVDQISRKFKFRQVKTAAAEALTYAAKELGISREELEDLIVPNLGFDEHMERRFDYGSRSFRVLLSPSLELDIYDESDKRLKNLPAPGKRDEEEKAKAAYEEFKLLKKQLKTVVSNQKLRLEQALSAERLWSTEKWTELFVKNPVMHQFAMGLIWGCYENHFLKDTFRYMEDGSFNTVDEDEYELPDSGLIGLVHPIELEKETLDAWKEQLSDYEVTQPLEQLSRPVYRLTGEEKKQKELTRFGGRLLNGLSLSGKLQNQGWYRGSVQDGGVYDTFYREDKDLGVELSFSGLFVGDENEEVTVYGAVFYKAGTVKRGSYVYDKVKDKDQYALSDVSPRYFSEIVLQLTRATASSQEQLPYPACKDRT